VFFVSGLFDGVRGIDPGIDYRKIWFLSGREKLIGSGFAEQKLSVYFLF
jgi:hypothetical protein